MHWILAVAGALSLCTAGLAFAASGSPPLTQQDLLQGYRSGRVIARPRASLLGTIDGVERGEGYHVHARFSRFGGVGVLDLQAGDSVQAAIARLRATGRYDFVEPDYIRKATATPNDPDFVNQWGLNNTGANGGVAGADIHAEAGWNTATNAASTLIVGMLDSGALLTHQDLQPNLWVNPTGGGQKVMLASASDSTGAATSVTDTDSLNGLNAVAGSGAPVDDVGHGTHTSGIVGAVGNNSLGVSGVAWKVQLMELKFLDSTGSGTLADELACISYAIDNKVSILSASFGSQGASQAEMNAIQTAGAAGIIFVCAAGNSAENIDISPFFPADYPLDNIICVGATDNRDLPSYFSNYGSGSVELFAPGENILSTYYSSDSAYAYLSGTSMATPMVSGAVALVRTQFPGENYRQTINRILNSVDANPALAGKCQTGGRLNLETALTTAPSTAPNALFANRTVLVGLDPYTRSNNAYTPATGDSNLPPLGGTHPLWWQWTAPEDATVEIDTSGTFGGTSGLQGGSSYATLLGVYSGSALGSLTPVATDQTYASETVPGVTGSVPYSEVSFHATKGATYQILVESAGSSTGQTILAINTTPDNSTVGSPTVLAGPSASLLDANSNTTTQAGAPAIGGNAGYHTLWYSWTAPASGPHQASAYSYDFNPEVAVYTGTTFSNLQQVAEAVSTGNVGTTTAISGCSASFTATAGATYLIAVAGQTANDIGEFTVSIDDALWQYTTQDAVTCSPAVGPDGTVYVGSNDNSIYALTPQGAKKWSYAAGGLFDTSAAAVAADGTVYAGNSDGNLYAFNPDGSLKWTFTVPTPAASSGLGNSVDASPAVGADGTVYMHADDGNLYAISPAGAKQWTASVPSGSYAAPTLAPDGTIYIGTDAGQFYAFNPNGTAKWTFAAPVAGEGIYTAAAIDASGNLYIATLSGNVYSVSPQGALRWTFSSGDAITSAPAVANGSLYFGGYDGNLYSLSTSTGAVNWKYALGAQVRASAPAIDSNGVVYIGCYDHNVYAVSSSGALVRIYATDDWVRSSPVIVGSTLYVGSNDHRVYAFNIGAGPAQADWPMYQYDSHRAGRVEVAVTQEPTAESIATGGTVSLSVAATGPGSLTYQWNFNGAAIPGATGSTYTLSAATPSNSGTYTVTITSGSVSTTSPGATVTVAAPGSSNVGKIINLSARANVGTGGNILIAGFVIQGTGSKSVLLRGVGPTLGTSPFDVSGFLAAPQLTLINSSQTTLVTSTSWDASLAALFSQLGAFGLQAGSADDAVEESLPAGSYTSQIAGVGFTSGVALAEIYDADPITAPTSLVNISARADVGTGGNLLIAGFVIGGSQPVTVLLRGIGPTLGTAPFNVSGALTQAKIDLYNSAQTDIQSSTSWDPSLSSVFSQVGAFALPAGSADAAIEVTLNPGSYTLQLSSANGGTGVGLVEVYLVP